MFEGTPVYIEFTGDGRVFSILTEEWHTKKPPLDRYAAGMPDPFVRYNEYDVDYCDSHGHYHASLAGSGPAGYFPKLMHNRVDGQDQPVSYPYWIASHLEVDLSQCRAPACCIALSESELTARILPEHEEQQAFLREYPQSTVENLLTFWYETGLVEEGKVVYCALCDCHYDDAAWVPCQHIAWCETCGEWSVPQGECPHRSTDDTAYVRAAEEE